MGRPTIVTPQIDRSPPRDDWQQSALLSGFLATFCLSVVVTGAYLFADNAGDASGGTIDRWLYGLVNNVSTDRTTDFFFLAMGLNIAVGLILATIYAGVAEPRLAGSGWRKGMLFSLLPFVLSLVILFPILGIGIFGYDAGAGPLAALGSLVAHLVYGFVLGGFFGSRLEDWEGASEHDLDAARLSNRGSARGLAIGLPIGAGLGFLMMPLLDDLAGAVAIVLAYTLLGGAFGLLIGSFMGMNSVDSAADRSDD